MLSFRMFFISLVLLLVSHSTSFAAETPTPVLESFSVPDGLTVEKVAGSDLSAYPMFITFDDTGRLFVCESSGKDISGKEMASSPECTILRLTDENNDGVYDSKSVFADTLSLPMGMLWRNGSLFVASPPDLLRFDDLDGDGVAENREVLLSGWNVLNTASLHGPFLGPDGLLYLTHGRHGYKITTKEGEHLEGLASRIWRCRMDGGGLERFAGGGFDNPVELIFSPAGEMLGTMTYFTDPRMGQRDALMHFVEGGVYPKPHESTSEFIRTGDLMPVMTKFSRIAPSGLLQYQSAALGEEYKGNLFSAQFNPHRIQRHVLERDGASYRTVDSNFVTSGNPYFYPTDLLEDADGTLLFCDTGAWYVDACPISRVSMPEIKGGIYRIRTLEKPLMIDPWGNSTVWKSLTGDELAAHLGDARFKVREKASEEILSRGKSALPALNTAYKQANKEARLGIVGALWRMGDKEVLPLLRLALADDDMDVRILSATALGALQDKKSVGPLLKLLQSDAAPVQREAALALGKLGDAKVVPHLLYACANPADRFVDHELIYALIRLGDEKALRKALLEKSAGVRKAAMIALDQMEGEFLAADDVMPFLIDKDAELRRQALWVASLHPDWAGAIADSLQNVITSDNVSEEELAPVKEIFLAYANNDKIQTIVADALLNSSGNTVGEFSVNLIAESEVKDFPKVWLAALAQILRDKNNPLIWNAVALVRSRDLPDFDNALSDLANDTDANATLRLNTLAALISRHDVLDGQLFAFLLSTLENAKDPLVAQNALSVLTRAKLSGAQRVSLAETYIPKADALTLPMLLKVFARAEDMDSGKALLNALEKVKPHLARVKAKDFDRAFAAYPENVRNAAATLRPPDKEYPQELLEKFARLQARKNEGDVGLGRRLFFSEKAACSTCHTVGEEGGHLGPDLSSVGAVRNRDDLLESLLFPSANILQDYPSVNVELEWESYAGIIAEESADTVVLRTGAEQTLRLPRKDIKSITPSEISLMPEGLDSGLSEEELLDLVAFLMSLNNEVWLLPGRFEGKEH